MPFKSWDSPIHIIMELRMKHWEKVTRTTRRTKTQTLTKIWIFRQTLLRLLLLLLSLSPTPHIYHALFFYMGPLHSFTFSCDNTSFTHFNFFTFLIFVSSSCFLFLALLSFFFITSILTISSLSPHPSLRVLAKTRYISHLGKANHNGVTCWYIRFLQRP